MSMESPEAVNFLLVDDLDENLIALEALLQRDGVQLFKARSGEQALELMLVHDFALALLDVQMPGMDGFELAELMRGTERTRRIPIIFLTAVATDEKRRFRGYESGAVDYLFKPLDAQLLKNKADVFFELNRQRQELARQRDELGATAEQLARAMARLQAHGDNSPLAMVQFDAEFRLMAWSNGAERMFGWSGPEVLGKRISDLDWLHEEDLSAFEALSEEARSGKSARNVHVCRSYTKTGSVLECEWYNSALRDSSGKLITVSSLIQDISERKRAEKTQLLLIGELNHRVKNMLATVQAIATQTLRHHSDPTLFATKFAGRLQTLARAHSLLSNTTWQGAMLADLIQDQLHIGTVDESRLIAIGPELRLPPQLALHLALILHELVTNANKYGALSTAEGRIDLSWRIDDSFLRLNWAERGGPAVAAPSRHGFGTLLIEQSAKADGGAARASYRADGIDWEIAVKLPPPADYSSPRDIFPKERIAGAERATGTGRVPSSLAGLRVLIVEDEPLVALELTAMLQDSGAEVIGPAATAQQALQMIDASQLDATLLDGNLHGLPVDEIAAALTRRKIPFLFISGYGKESLPPSFRNAPMIAKPFAPHQLLEALTNLLRKQSEIIKLRR
jgi:PAS domain S-box-containing protein